MGEEDASVTLVPGTPDAGLMPARAGDRAGRPNDEERWSLKAVIRSIYNEGAHEESVKPGFRLV
jgi:hypothetical protein